MLVVACSLPGWYNLGMSKKKPDKAKPVTKTQKKPAADKLPVLYVRLTPAHDAALDDFIQRQKAKPDRQAVGLAALESFLEQEGLWPPGEANR